VIITAAPSADRQRAVDGPWSVILLVYVARGPVGVWRPPAAHPWPMAKGITAGYATRQPLPDGLRRWPRTVPWPPGQAGRWR